MSVIKILTIVISMLFVIILLDLILVHVILDTLAMGFHALVSISHNCFETEVYKTVLLTLNALGGGGVFHPPVRFLADNF